MTKAIDLARNCGIQYAPHFAADNTDMIGSDRAIEAFYHAARAEILRELADEFDGSEAYGRTAAVEDLGPELRAMADREGK